MKKEYVNPTISIIVLDCAGMLCTSGTTSPETPNFDTPDTEEWSVNKDKVSDGEIL